MNTLLEIIKEVECLLWGIIIVVGLFIVLKHGVLPIVQLWHERKMKKDANTREKQWADYDKVKACTDEKVQEQLQQLKKQNKDLQNQLELEKLNQTILNKQLETYKSFMSALNLEIIPKTENSKKE